MSFSEGIISNVPLFISVCNFPLAKNNNKNKTIQYNFQVLVPPKIDESNIIGNPLSILGTRFALECPVSGENLSKCV